MRYGWNVSTMLVVIREHALFGSRLPTLLQNIYLLGDIAQSADDFLVTIEEGKNRIRDPSVAAELQNQLLGAPQVMARDPGEEMVNSLELQSTVEKVKPSRAVNVHCGAEHLLREGLVDAKVGGGHGEVGECDLYMQRGGDHMGHEKED